MDRLHGPKGSVLDSVGPDRGIPVRRLTDIKDVQIMLDETQNAMGFQKESISRIYGTISLRYGDYESECR